MVNKTEEEDKEVDSMAETVEYNEKIFLSELEASLQELQEMKKVRNSHSAQSSWRDVFKVMVANIEANRSPKNCFRMIYNAIKNDE